MGEREFPKVITEMAQPATGRAMAGFLKEKEFTH